MEDAADGRAPMSLRPLACDQGELQRAAGSARFSHQHSAALVAVFGPTGAQKRQEIVNRACIEVVYKPLSAAPGAAEKEKESVLRQLVEAAVMTHLHPRTVIQVVVQELNNDGSMLAVVINAVCVALLDAGVPLRHTFVAASVATRLDGTVLLDPTAADEELCKSTCTFTYRAGGGETAGAGAEAVSGDFALLGSAPGGCEVVGNVGGGAQTEDEYWAALGAGRASAQKVAAFVRQHIEHHYARIQS
jgi:exosome complex component RRP46